jgi:hypothetical protein
MLTSLEIENFKGIGARQRVDFAQLTLLFGANSAGKSSILQALVYLHELIERGSADVDRTELGGHVLELGGFARLVHQHDAARGIVLRAEFATPGGLERFGRDLTDFPFPDLDDEVESAWLELSIEHRTMTAFQGPVVSRVRIGVNGDSEPLVWLEVGTTMREGEPLHARVNLGHPLLATETRELPGGDATEADGTGRPIVVNHAPAEVTEAWEQVAIPEEEPHRELEAEGGGNSRGTGAGAGLGDGRGFGDGRSLPVFALARPRASALPAPGEPLRVVAAGDIEGDQEELVSLRRKPASDEVETTGRDARGVDRTPRARCAGDPHVLGDGRARHDLAARGLPPGRPVHRAAARDPTARVPLRAGRSHHELGRRPRRVGSAPRGSPHARRADERLAAQAQRRLQGGCAAALRGQRRRRRRRGRPRRQDGAAPLARHGCGLARAAVGGGRGHLSAHSRGGCGDRRTRRSIARRAAGDPCPPCRAGGAW